MATPKVNSKKSADWSWKPAKHERSDITRGNKKVRQAQKYAAQKYDRSRQIELPF